MFLMRFFKTKRGVVVSFKKNIFKIIVIIAVTVLVVLNGLYFGLGFNKVGVVNTIKILGIYSLINKSYVNDVVSDKLVAGMIKGMVESLGDEHSIYLDKKMYQEMLKNNQLETYLKKLDREYDNKFSALVDKIMKKENIPENLTPGYPQMKWVGEVNNIRNRAKEILTAELCQ